MHWHSVFFSATQLLIWRPIFVFSESILLIGDSLDRNIEEDWCKYHNKTGRMMERGWGDDTIQYGGNYGVLRSPSYCVNLDSNESIAALHTYGSSENGPYSPNHWQKQNGTINESGKRIEMGLTQYIDTFGLPNRVFYQANNWDCQLLRETHRINLLTDDDKQFISKEFASNSNQRIDQILKHIDNYKTTNKINKDVIVGIRTSPFSSIMYSCPMFNKVLLDIAVERSLIVYDYNADVWSLFADRNPADVIQYVMRANDCCHPKSYFSASAGDKLLGNHYTTHLIDYRNTAMAYTHNSSNSDKFKLHFFYNLHEVNTSKISAKCMAVKRGSHDQLCSTEYFYTEFVNNTRFKWQLLHPSHISHYTYTHAINQNPTNLVQYTCEQHKIYVEKLLKMMLLTSSDLLVVTHEFIKSLPTLGYFPLIVNTTHSVGIITSTVSTFHNTSYFVSLPHANLIIPVKNATYFNIFKAQQVLTEVDIKFLDFLWCEPTLPDFYKEHMLIRYVADKCIYMVENGEKRAFTNWNAFVSRGFDTDQVQVINQKLLIDVLPFGPDLQ